MNQKITKQEEAVLDMLAEAWNLFNALPVQHDSDKSEFMFAIHAAQNIVLARPMMREWRGTGADFKGKLK